MFLLIMVTTHLQKASSKAVIGLFCVFQLFIVALSFAYFSKALTGTYMKSSLTQIERRFDLSSSHIGLIDGSFEMGNLLFLAVVSHFGAQLHRPRLIAAGCLLMAVGALFTGLTHFFMGRKIKKSNELKISFLQFNISVLISQNSLLIIFFHADSVAITPKDARWVGAWWMGFLVSSSLLLISSIPFWFLPRSLPKQEEQKGKSTPTHVTSDQTAEALSSKQELKLTEIAKAFLPSLKRLLGTPAYFLLLIGSILKFNSFIGLFTFKAKYIEQQFGQSASRANFLIGVLNLPAVAMGIFLGGLLMRRYKLSVVSGAQLSFATSFMGYLLLLLQFGTKCDNIPIAGLTVSYNGTKTVLYNGEMLFSECNRNCSCSAEQWDPVCSGSGITYISPCMAGCLTSSGHGKHTVFNNCSCVSASFPVGSTTSVRMGQCPHAKDCSRSFTSYMAVSVLSSFINALGATPGYMVIIRCIPPDLKSLALGIQALVTRTLGGIPAPVYFGALIDSTCLKWSVKKCGGRGACRTYDSDMYRIIFLGLITCLSGLSYFFIIAVIILLRRQFSRPGWETELQLKSSKETEIKNLSKTIESSASFRRTRLRHEPKVCINTMTESEEGGRTHQRPEADGPNSMKIKPEPKSETTAELTPRSPDRVNT
uniref:Solute carrier organic anion transporter family member n=1 Tax=Nothobranchius furzeri TaxID=105023 RepID=A0A8C6KSR6_NOTFU